MKRMRDTFPGDLVLLRPYTIVWNPDQHSTSIMIDLFQRPELRSQAVLVLAVGRSWGNCCLVVGTFGVGLIDRFNILRTAQAHRDV